MKKNTRPEKSNEGPILIQFWNGIISALTRRTIDGRLLRIFDTEGTNGSKSECLIAYVAAVDQFAQDQWQCGIRRRPTEAHICRELVKQDYWIPANLPSRVHRIRVGDMMMCAWRIDMKTLPCAAELRHAIDAQKPALGILAPPAVKSYLPGGLEHKLAVASAKKKGWEKLMAVLEAAKLTQEEADSINLVIGQP